MRPKFSNQPITFELNWIGIVRFEFESNLEALHVPNLLCKSRWGNKNSWILWLINNIHNWVHAQRETSVLMATFWGLPGLVWRVLNRCLFLMPSQQSQCRKKRTWLGIKAEMHTFVTVMWPGCYSTIHWFVLVKTVSSSQSMWTHVSLAHSHTPVYATSS